MKQAIAHLNWRQAPKGIVHPLIFAVFPILSLYVKNMGKGFLSEAVSIAIGVLVFAILLWLFVGLFVKDRHKAAIIISAFFVLFFSYGHVITAFSVALDRMQLLDRARFLVESRSGLFLWLAAWSGLFVAVSCYAVRTTRDVRPVTQFLNIVALALLVMVGVNFAVTGVKTFVMPRLRANAKPGAGANLSSVSPLAPGVASNAGQDSSDVAVSENPWQQTACLEEVGVTPGTLPDIYYIIVDAYARADILEEVYQFDNSEFLSYLAEKGFYVADKSVANYAQSALSLASSLNSTYLDGLVAQMGTETDNRQPLQAMIKDSRVFQYLHSHGYSIFAFSSGYGFTEIRNADIYMAPPQWNLSEFQEALITLTPLSILRKTWLDIRRERIVYAFDHMADATQIDQPTFVFVHIIIPHWPFIFDADGDSVQPPNGMGMRADYEYDEFIAGYRNQLAFVNARLQATIDEILSRSPAPPVIIVQSDHGSDARLDYGGWEIQKTYLPERMSIFNAYYFPDQDYAVLHRGITPVNTFRAILDQYLGTHCGLLEDRSYFSGWAHPYSLTDVTDEVVLNN